MTDEMSHYLSGKKLYGDDFSQAEIEKWFSDESEGYSSLGAKNTATYSYAYHQLNKFHAFRFLDSRCFDLALGLGSAYGCEFDPIAHAIKRIIIIDPSCEFSTDHGILGVPDVPTSYLKPKSNGDIDFPSCHFDLITSLGVMHHIPNVSHVLNECYRCIKPNGVMLLHEPVTSMGDWRHPRVGLTKRERGIPRDILDQIISDAGFAVVRRAYCNFPVVPKIVGRFGVSAYNNRCLTTIDACLSGMFSWNMKYHRTTFFSKLAPAGIFYILTKLAPI